MSSAAVATSPERYSSASAQTAVNKQGDLPRTSSEHVLHGAGGGDTTTADAGGPVSPKAALAPTGRAHALQRITAALARRYSSTSHLSLVGQTVGRGEASGLKRPRQQDSLNAEGQHAGPANESSLVNSGLSSMGHCPSPAVFFLMRAFHIITCHRWPQANLSLLGDARYETALQIETFKLNAASQRAELAMQGAAHGIIGIWYAVTALGTLSARGVKRFGFGRAAESVAASFRGRCLVFALLHALLCIASFGVLLLSLQQNRALDRVEQRNAAFQTRPDRILTQPASPDGAQPRNTEGRDGRFSNGDSGKRDSGVSVSGGATTSVGPSGFARDMAERYTQSGVPHASSRGDRQLRWVTKGYLSASMCGLALAAALVLCAGVVLETLNGPWGDGFGMAGGRGDALTAAILVLGCNMLQFAVADGYAMTVLHSSLSILAIGTSAALSVAAVWGLPSSGSRGQDRYSESAVEVDPLMLRAGSSSSHLGVLYFMIAAGTYMATMKALERNLQLRLITARYARQEARLLSKLAGAKGQIDALDAEMEASASLLIDKFMGSMTGKLREHIHGISALVSELRERSLARGAGRGAAGASGGGGRQGASGTPPRVSTGSSSGRPPVPHGVASSFSEAAQSMEADDLSDVLAAATRVKELLEGWDGEKLKARLHRRMLPTLEHVKASVEAEGERSPLPMFPPRIVKPGSAGRGSGSDGGSPLGVGFASAWARAEPRVSAPRPAAPVIRRGPSPGDSAVPADTDSRGDTAPLVSDWHSSSPKTSAGMQPQLQLAGQQPALQMHRPQLRRSNTDPLSAASVADVSSDAYALWTPSERWTPASAAASPTWILERAATRLIDTAGDRGRGDGAGELPSGVSLSIDPTRSRNTARHGDGRMIGSPAFAAGGGGAGASAHVAAAADGDQLLQQQHQPIRTTPTATSRPYLWPLPRAVVNRLTGHANEVSPHSAKRWALPRGRSTPQSSLPRIDEIPLTGGAPSISPEKDARSVQQQQQEQRKQQHQRPTTTENGSSVGVTPPRLPLQRGFALQRPPSPLPAPAPAPASPLLLIHAPEPLTGDASGAAQPSPAAAGGGGSASAASLSLSQSPTGTDYEAGSEGLSPNVPTRMWAHDAAHGLQWGPGGDAGLVTRGAAGHRGRGGSPFGATSPTSPFAQLRSAPAGLPPVAPSTGAAGHLYGAPGAGRLSPPSPSASSALTSELNFPGSSSFKHLPLLAAPRGAASQLAEGSFAGSSGAGDTSPTPTAGMPMGVGVTDYPYPAGPTAAYTGIEGDDGEGLASPTSSTLVSMFTQPFGTPPGQHQPAQPQSRYYSPKRASPPRSPQVAYSPLLSALAPPPAAAAGSSQQRTIHQSNSASDDDDALLEGEYRSALPANEARPDREYALEYGFEREYRSRDRGGPMGKPGLASAASGAAAGGGVGDTGAGGGGGGIADTLAAAGISLQPTLVHGELTDASAVLLSTAAGGSGGSGFALGGDAAGSSSGAHLVPSGSSSESDADTRIRGLAAAGGGAPPAPRAVLPSEAAAAAAAAAGRRSGSIGGPGASRSRSAGTDAADEEVDGRTGFRFGLHVLVVDDEAVNRKVTGRMLERLGCTYDAVEDGDEIVGALVTSERPYDAILLDVVMKRTNGIEVCRSLRDQHVDLPIIAATANYAPREAAIYKAAGFTRVLTKPFTRKDVAAALTQALGIQLARVG